ncbi:MAG: hypothetical protein QY329_09035 [Anaerolineales bacterium]|nr:MAG: hypothetical protein QY329_09035 [Anaerolineales bacterium]
MDIERGSDVCVDGIAVRVSAGDTGVAVDGIWVAVNGVGAIDEELHPTKRIANVMQNICCNNF